MIYYEYSMSYDARSKFFVRINTCSKAFFQLIWRYGKSPCFLSYSILKVFSVDVLPLNLSYPNGVFFLG